MRVSGTSVKMSDAAKSRLEELQAAIKLETGRKVTQQDLLDVLVEHAFESREEIFDHFRDDWEPLTEEEIERFHEGTFASGSPLDEEDIDDVLYGSGSEHTPGHGV